MQNPKKASPTMAIIKKMKNIKKRSLFFNIVSINKERENKKPKKNENFFGAKSINFGCSFKKSLIFFEIMEVKLNLKYPRYLIKKSITKKNNKKGKKYDKNSSIKIRKAPTRKVFSFTCILDTGHVLGNIIRILILRKFKLIEKTSIEIKVFNLNFCYFYF